MIAHQLRNSMASAVPPSIQRSAARIKDDDPHEKEADGMAQQVARGIGHRNPSIGEGSPHLHSVDNNAQLPPPLAAQIDGARGGGVPLPRGVRRSMEETFSANFVDVRIHDNPTADGLNRFLGARAFTTGRDVFFRGDQFENPGSTTARELLAHELTHVVQQQGAASQLQRQADPPPGGGAQVPAARVVYIDSNIIIQINRGNQDVAAALLKMRSSGVDIRISPYQYGELVTRPDLPRTATAQRLMLEEMNIGIGASPTLAQRVDVNLAGQTRAGGNIMQLKDQQQVSSARADGRNVEIWSLDTPFSSNPRQVETTYRIRVAPESALAVTKGTSPDYRVGRSLLNLEPITISLNGQVTRGTPLGGGTGGEGPPTGGGGPLTPATGGSAAAARFGTGTRVVAGGLGIIVVVNEILGGINRVRNIQQQNIDMGEARLAFWDRFGGSPIRGVWDQNERRPLPSSTTPETSYLGSPSFPYVVDIDVAGLERNLPSRIEGYQDFLYFLDAGKTLQTIEEDEPLPEYPTRAQKNQQRHYYAWVNQPDRANRRRYDITHVIEKVRSAAAGELEEAMRYHIGSLSPAEKGNVFRLKSGSATRIYRSAGGLQPIHTAQQVFGLDPWVRTIGRQEDVGGWFSTDVRVLVVPANADAQRAALVSGYWVKQPIDDTYDEVRQGGRPILDRQPAEGPITSFVAGPEPGLHSRFGKTRYYRHGDPDIRWTIALGELREFWVRSGDLAPVSAADIESYARNH